MNKESNARDRQVPPFADDTSVGDDTRSEGVSSVDETANGWPKIPWNARLLLFVTLCTTGYAGLVQSAGYHNLQHASSLLGFDMGAVVGPWYSFPSVIGQALGFSLSLLAILFAHEMGHYLTARRQGVNVSFPVFLPSLPPFGTLGAFIRMESSKMPADRLMKVAAWGPFAGIFVAVPVLIIGLLLSDIRPLPVRVDQVTSLGSCLLMLGLEDILVGSAGPAQDIYLHPVAFAGWAGCFVTSLNLLPIGQLDGGHIVCALCGEKKARVIALAGMGLLAVGSWFYLGWAVFGFVIYLFLGWEHPPLIDDESLSRSQQWMGWCAVALFVLTLAPVPIYGGGLRDILPELSFWWHMQGL